MTAADITYVDHDPLIPTHLGTDAPHVHVRTTDQCLRRPDGAHCPTPAELRAEVERLRADLQRVQRDALQGHLTTHARHVVRLSSEMERSEDAEARAESAEAEVERLRGFSTHRQAALNARLDSTEKIARDVMAERDALQQRLDNVQALADEFERRQNGALWYACEKIRAALGGPAAPPQEPQPTPDNEEIAMTPETCPQHKPVQHRDAQPPWCNTCGWTAGGAAVEPRQVKLGLKPFATVELMDGTVIGDGTRLVTVRARQQDEQPEPVERITDANGDETERGADTDTENTHQQNGDHR